MSDTDMTKTVAVQRKRRSSAPPQATIMSDTDSAQTVTVKRKKRKSAAALLTDQIPKMWEPYSSATIDDIITRSHSHPGTVRYR